MIENPPDRRADSLADACGDDSAFRSEVEKLIKAEEQAGQFLEASAERDFSAVLEPGSRTPASQAPLPGANVGSYRLLRHIGQGGSSAVYLAVRADSAFSKRVAVKLIRRGLDEHDVLRRFQAERQILASLDHPFIAKLLDGGSTPDGVPFVVMEYVEGMRIDEYCDYHRLSVGDRVALFCQVCSAVQYAHQNMVVHRDIKPSNILVNAEGMPKLLDFGIAKLLNPELSALELAPTMTWQRMMTPHYASPEQILGRLTTTTSDVYSLGVLLYKLLTGRLPYQFSARSVREAERMLTESEPVAPSAVVVRDPKTPGNGGKENPLSAASLARLRGLRVEQLCRRLTGDLDTIVAVSLRKEPRRRYGSVEQLLADLRRHQLGLPVMARGDSRRYRAGKFLRRHRGMVTLAFLLAVATAALIASLSVQSTRVARERDHARMERDKNAEVLAFMEDLFKGADPLGKGADNVTAREIVERAVKRIDQLEGQPAVQAALQTTLGNIYGDLGLYAEAQSLLADALEIRRALPGTHNAEVVDSLSNLGVVLGKMGRLEEAERINREALTLRRRLWGGEHIEIARNLNDLAILLQLQGKYDEAEPYGRESLLLYRKLRGDEHNDVATSLSTLAVVLTYRHQYDEAEQLYREALAIWRKLFGEDHALVATCLSSLAHVLRKKGDWAAAEPYSREALLKFRRVLGEEHPDVFIVMGSLAVILRYQGEYEESEQLLRKALPGFRKFLGEDHKNVAWTVDHLAEILRLKGKFEEAEALFDEALEIGRRAVGEAHHRVADIEGRRALLFAATGRARRAESLLRGSIETLRRAYPEGHPEIAVQQSRLGACLLELERPEEAEPLLEEGFAAAREDLGERHYETILARQRLEAFRRSRAESKPRR